MADARPQPGHDGGELTADNMADDDRWTVRGVSEAYREQATDAASRHKIPVGAYLCRALDRELQAERAPLDLVVSRPVADMTADIADIGSDMGSRMALIERAVVTAIALAGSPEMVPPGFRRRANRLLRDSLPAPVARAAAGKRPAISDGAGRLAAANGVDDGAAHALAVHGGGVTG